jgi:flavin-dependent dehydrogenase
MFFTDRTEQSENGIDMAHILQHAPLLRSRRANSRIIRSRLVPVRSHCQLEMTGDSWLLAGDRAATFDPLSGMGVFQAWAHSKAAADAVLAALKGQPETASAHYQQTLTATWHRYRTERIAHYQSEPRWPESHFWQRRRVHSQAHLEQTHH